MADDERDERADATGESSNGNGGRGTRDGERGSGEEGRTDDVHEWFGSNVPAGQRGGVDEEAARKLATRERAKQRVSQHDRALRKFTNAQFVAHATDNIKFNKNGDMLITLQVPFQFKHLAMPLTDAFGIPLSIDVQIWQPYREAEQS